MRRNKSGHDAEWECRMHDIRFIRDNPDAFDARSRGAGWSRRRSG